MISKSAREVSREFETWGGCVRKRKNGQINWPREGRNNVVSVQGSGCPSMAPATTILTPKSGRIREKRSRGKLEEKKKREQLLGRGEK